MNEHLPGVSVPDALIEALEASGPEAEAIGTAQCVEIVTAYARSRGSRAST